MKKLLPIILVVLATMYSLCGIPQQAKNVVSSQGTIQNQQPRKVMVGEVELHYIEQGKGEPLILLHGGQGDYRAWPRQVEAFASRYRVISYSRRCHYPNKNQLTSTNHSALVDAIDLAGFVAALKLGPVHLVGTSYGAFTALTFATDQPELVRSMVLAEPPLLEWAAKTERGAMLYREFMETVHNPAGKKFTEGDDEGAMRIFLERFDGHGAFDSLPEARRQSVMQMRLSSKPLPLLRTRFRICPGRKWEDCQCQY